MQLYAHTFTPTTHEFSVVSQRSVIVLRVSMRVE
jgi:hypothetical protein